MHTLFVQITSGRRREVGSGGTAKRPVPGDGFALHLSNNIHYLHFVSGFSFLEFTAKEAHLHLSKCSMSVLTKWLSLEVIL